MTDLHLRYLACWNEADPAARQALASHVFADDVRYVDPLVDVRGVDSLLATIGAVRAQFPGFEFAPIGDVDAHHDLARFAWGLGPAGAEPVVIGFDVVGLDAGGRIVSVHGFLDRVPS